MSIAGKEALAGLQLLVAVAKADGELTLDERAVIEEALDDARLPDGITAGALIGSSSDVDSLIAQIQAQDARDVASAACVTMANANGACVPKQQAILDKIETAWAAHLEPTAEARRRAHAALIAELAVECEAGCITLADYELRVVELK